MELHPNVWVEEALDALPKDLLDRNAVGAG